MNDQDAAFRAIVDANRYTTIATADEDGRPWASPVWFAQELMRVATLYFLTDVR